MKTKSSLVLNDAPAPYASGAPPERSGEMVRTQIYLTPSEHAFLTAESRREGKPMAALIRSYIDEKMALPADIWANNPLLQEPAGVTDFEGREDGAINHDHYIYGCPKKYKKVRGKWVLLPPLP